MCTSKEYGQTGHEKCGEVAYDALSHLDLEREVDLKDTEIKHTPLNPGFVLLIVSGLNEFIVYGVELENSPTKRVVSVRELKQVHNDFNRN